MARNERSSARLATLAAKLMHHHDAEVRELAASVQTQAPDHQPLTDHDRLIAEIDAELRKHYSPNDLAQYKPLTMADPLQNRLATTAKLA